MLNKGDILDSRYSIESKIGQGGMSTVYRAVDRKLGRKVAVKVLKEEFSNDEEFIRKFKNEAQSAASLIHPNIVAAYDAVDEGNLHYIIMELVEGISLKDYIGRKGVLSNKETIGIALQTAEGISQAHKNGIIHRDIKPQNIIISKEGKVKVADFGIAKAVTGETISTAVLGSVHYISPEQAKSATADARSDIYSLGITMYEMITGMLPFRGENTVEVVMAHINQAAVPSKVHNRDIYPSLNDIILKCIRKNPNERYQTADELIADLKQSVNDPEGHFVSLYEAARSGSSREKMSGAESAEEAPEDSDPLKNIFDTFIDRKVIIGLIAMGAFAIALVLIAHGVKTRETESASAAAVTEAPYSETGTASVDVSIVIAGEQTAPPLAGLTVDEAKSLLNDKQATLVIGREEFSDIYLEGRIIDQEPEEGTAIKPGDMIHVTVSLGSRLDSVINSLNGATVEDATARLLDVGVNVSGIRKQFSDDVAEGLVIGYILDDAGGGQEPASSAAGETKASEAFTGTKVAAGSTIKLLTSAGREADGAVMPYLIGLGYSETLNVLSGNGLTIGSVSRVSDQSALPGKVTWQSVQSGDIIRKGTAVSIRINLSEGDPLEGETRPEAETGSDAPYGYDDNEMNPQFYYGSIDTEYQVGAFSGPSGGTSTVNIGIRLLQKVNDGYEYTILAEPRQISSGTRIPVTYRRIRGALGVDKGTIEVYDSDTDAVLAAYEIEFHPVG